MSVLRSGLCTGEFIVKRSGAAAYVNGNYVPGPVEEIKVIGSMQPTNARELKLPEEGNRLKQYFKFFTDEPILVNSMQTLADSDKICVNGEWFRTMSVGPWQGFVDMPYFMTIIYREPSQASDGAGAC